MSHLTAEISERARALVDLYPEPRSALIPLCHLAQEQDGWLVPEALSEIGELCGVTAAEVRGTATFYDMLHVEPVGTPQRSAISLMASGTSQPSWAWARWHNGMSAERGSG